MIIDDKVKSNQGNVLYNVLMIWISVHVESQRYVRVIHDLQNEVCRKSIREAISSNWIVSPNMYIIWIRKVRQR